MHNFALLLLLECCN